MDKTQKQPLYGTFYQYLKLLETLFLGKAKQLLYQAYFNHDRNNAARQEKAYFEATQQF